MNYLKTILLTLCLFAAAWLGYYLQSNNSGDDFDQLIDSYLSDDPKKIENDLKKFKAQIPDAQYLLYEAYLARKEKDLITSDRKLAEALKATANETRTSFLLEVALNQAFNAYILHDKPALESAVQQAASIDEHNGWVRFFKGLLAYEKGECTKALNIWTKEEERIGLSYWMRVDFSGAFTPTWLTLHIARCEINEEMVTAARDLLEGQSRLLQGPELEEVLYLIGYSYVVEANKKPPDEAILLYKQAFSYFNRLPISEVRYAKERAQISENVAKKALELINEKQLRELNDYIVILEEWNAEIQLEKISREIGSFIHRQIIDDRLQSVSDMANTLNTLFPSGEMRDKIGKILEQSLAKGIETENVRQLDVDIRISKLFNSSSDKFSQHTAALLDARFADAFENNDEDPGRIKAYIKLFDRLDPDAATLRTLTDSMFQKGMQEWKTGRYLRAENIFEGTLGLLNNQDKANLQKRIADGLAEAYQNSFRDNDLEQLQFILKTAAILQVPEVNFQDSEHIRKALLIARRFYFENNFRIAIKKARWILTLDPHQADAQSILALSLYNVGDFQEALVQLQKIETYSSEEIEALAVVLQLTDHPIEGMELLENLQNIPDFRTRTMRNLAIGNLLDDDPEQALRWIALIEQVDDEVRVAQLYADHASDQWDEAIKVYSELPPAFRSIPLLKEFAAAAFMSSGNSDEAQKYLKEMLETPKSSLDFSFTGLFSEFMHEKILPYNAGAAAAIFYDKSAHDLAKASEYFHGILDPSPQVLLQLASLEKRQEKMFEAKATLQKAFDLLKDRTDEDDLKGQILFAEGQLFMELKAYPEAVSAFMSSFSLLSAKRVKREEYALALMGMQRYDLALQQWTDLSQKEALSLANEIDLVDCLIHLKEFIPANGLARKIVKDNKEIPLAERLRLARLMLISENPETLKTLLEKLNIASISAFPETVQLIKLMMESGDMPRAWIYASDFKEILIKKAEGYLLLAELATRSENQTQAVRYAELGYSLEPWNNLITLFLIEHNPEDTPLFTRIEKEYKAEPTSPTPLLTYVYSLIEKDLNSTSPTPIHLNTAPEIVNGLIRQNRMIPRAYALQGAVYLLTGNSEKATTALNTCLQLDPSNIIAYRYLSILYQEMGQYEESVISLVTALTFTPSDPVLWEQLSFLYEIEDDALDSQEALKKVMLFNPLHISARLRYAKLQMELQSLEESKQVLESVLEMDPKNIQALELLLKVLSDPTLTLNKEKNSQILEERKKIYERLRVLDPAKAEAIEKQTSSEPG